MNRSHAASRALVLLTIASLYVACVGDDPVTSTPTLGSRSITCDNVASCKGTQKCCGVGRDWIGSACKDDCGGAYELACDDAADCGAGLLCCYVTDGGARAARSFCKARCDAPGEKQLCAPASQRECTTGSCSPLTMFSPNGLSHCL